MSLLADMLKALDIVVGRPLCALAGAFLARGPEEAVREGVAPRRVLVIRPGGIGDAVLFVPLVRALAEAWPEARIDLLVERRNAGVVRELPGVARVLCYDRLREGVFAAIGGRYELVIDTEQYHVLSALVALATRAPRRIGFATNRRAQLFTESEPYDREEYEGAAFLRLASRATGRPYAWSAEDVFFPVSEVARERARAALAPLAGRRLAALHPGASIPERRWPPERYGEVARRLAEEEGLAVVVVGGPGDRRAAASIVAALEGLPHLDLSGRLDLATTAALLGEVSVYVSADTGVLHLAYGVGTPSVHLFGPGVLTKWGPPGARFTSVRHVTPCSPCTRYGYTPPCAQGLRCMLGITPDEVVRAVRENLAVEGEPS